MFSQKVTDKIARIAMASEQQASKSEMITRNFKSITQCTRETADSVRGWRKPLRISVAFLSSCWLSPDFSRFQLLHPNHERPISVQMTTEINTHFPSSSTPEYGREMEMDPIIESNAATS